MKKTNRSIIFIIAFFLLMTIIPAGLRSSADLDSVYDFDYINAGFIVKNSLILKIGEPKALLNGEIKQIDENNPNVVPFIGENDRTLVPVRFIAESLGYTVDYEAQEKKITISDYFNNSIVMYINVAIIEINGITFDIDASPVLTPESRTFIPLRAFVEIGLRRKIAYVASEQIIIISDYIINTDLAEEIAQDAIEIFAGSPVFSFPAYGATFVYPVSYPEKNGAYTYFISGDEGERYNSLFNPLHLAVDYNISAANEARDIFAVYPGIVEEIVESNSGYGNRVIIKHTSPDGTEFYSLYAHLAKIKVSKKAGVSAGQIIGEMGNSGTGGIHLHMTVWTGAMSKGPEQEIINPTSSEEITSTGKAAGVYGRIFYDIRKLVELQRLF